MFEAFFDDNMVHQNYITIIFFSDVLNGELETQCVTLLSSNRADYEIQNVLDLEIHVDNIL